MDVRLLIIAGTFLLLVASLAVFIGALARSARERRMGGPAPMPSPVSGNFGPSRPVDTDLEGLVVSVAPDAPSASLLTPLRTGEWAPPQQPAPATELAAASLSERIESFKPFPDIPEPAFAVQTSSPWVVEPTVSQAPAILGIPEVVVSEQPVEPSQPDWDEDFEAEIARLLPDDEPPMFEDSPPASAPIPVPPVVMPAPAPLPQPSPVPEVDFWEGQLREQQVAPVLSPRPAVAERPAVRVAEPAPIPAPAPEPVFVPPEPEPVKSSRPSARVHRRDGGVTEYTHVAAGERSANDAASNRRSDVPEMVMAAPVEMWFGDSRVGVKAGTATYDRFRKYADVLLADLAEATSRSV